ncbi:MAG: radical SAM protein [Thermodesulfobacteriota bacterium]|nr:radical SAM protein [Thermodesulfobacteriota bacterium]
MTMSDTTDVGFLRDLERCELCEHRCGVNRLRGETGLCRMALPCVASATLHPAPPESYTVFMAGCNFKCLNCQNWTISQYPDNGCRQRGYEDPEALARECVHHLTSLFAGRMGADRIFFSGGESTIHLPYIEEVVERARKQKPETKVNFDTNGYMTEKSLDRVLAFATSITYDLKAYDDEVHLALTGASSKPVLRNAEYIGKKAKEKLWEYRILVIPQINEDEIRPLTEFIASIDPSLPTCFLAFRPNFVLDQHPGAATALMERCLAMAEESGLNSAHWSGHTGFSGRVMAPSEKIKDKYLSAPAWLAGTYALSAGCKTHPRGCSTCLANQACPVKQYTPTRVT